MKSNKLSIKLITALIFFVLSIFILGAITYEEYVSCAPDWSSMCGFSTMMFNLPVSFLFTQSPLSDITQPTLSILLVILSSIFWSLIGACIGLLIEKIKGKK